MGRKSSGKKGMIETSSATGSTAVPRPNRSRLILGLILAAYCILGSLYLATVPFGNAPDENAHLLYVQQLAAGRLPVLDPADRANFEAHQPPLGYAVALPAYLLAGGRAHTAGQSALFALRGVSLLLGALVIVLVYWGVRLWLPRDPAAAMAAAAVTAFMPMRLAVFSSFSNDPLTETIFCATLLVLTLGLRDGFTRRRSLLAGALIGLGLLTKTTCGLLLPVALLAIFLRWRHTRTDGRAAWRHVLLILAAAFLISGPWLLRNQTRYGDPFALGAFDAYFSDRAGPEYFMTRQGLTFDEYLCYRVLPFTTRSFWGVFDHTNLWLGGPAEPRPGLPEDLIRRGSPEAPIYAVLIFLLYLLAAGMVAAAVRWLRAKPEPWQKDTALLWSLCLFLVAAAFLRFNLKYFQGQARYLYPAVLPIAAALATAWLAPWPARLRSVGAALWSAAFMLLAMYAWLGTLLRYFGKVGW